MDKLPFVRTLTSESDTQGLAERLAAGCFGGITVGLCGDLGAGKTTFVRFLLSALGGAGEQVSSPSFTLEHEYKLPSGMVVQHWDLYRLDALPAELLEPPASNVIRIVEWPDRVQGYAQSLELVLSLTVRETGVRDVHFTGSHAERFAGL